MPNRDNIATEHKGSFPLIAEITRKVAASIFIQSQCSKVCFNEMQALATSLQVGFAISGKEPQILAEWAD